MTDDITFTGYRPFVAEGARCGIITCEVCGAALLLDPSDQFDVKQRHREWHKNQNWALGELTEAVRGE